MDIKIIDSKTAITFLLPKHYSGRKPNISIAFGLFENEELKSCLHIRKTSKQYAMRRDMWKRTFKKCLRTKQTLPG